MVGSAGRGGGSAAPSQAALCVAGQQARWPCMEASGRTCDLTPSPQPNAPLASSSTHTHTPLPPPASPRPPARPPAGLCAAGRRAAVAVVRPGAHPPPPQPLAPALAPALPQSHRCLFGWMARCRPRPVRVRVRGRHHHPARPGGCGRSVTRPYRTACDWPLPLPAHPWPPQTRDGAVQPTAPLQPLCHADSCSPSCPLPPPPPPSSPPPLAPGLSAPTRGNRSVPATAIRWWLRAGCWWWAPR